MMKKKSVITIVLLFLTLVVASPLISRCGIWKSMHRWEAPVGTFGVNRQLSLSLQSFHAFVDPIGLYEEHRILITDGGYVYIIETDLNFYPEVSESKVEWKDDGVSITFPSEVVIWMPKGRIVEQVGP